VSEAPVLRCHGLEKRFGGVVALDGVHLEFPAAGLVAILGPNGAGKTTLFDALCGFQAVDRGRTFLGEREITRLPPHRIARLGMARTFQNLRVISRVSVLDNVLVALPQPLGESLLGIFQPRAVIRQETKNRETALRLLHFVSLEGEGAAVAGELSWGQQKLLSIAACLATGARILLLDEPIAGVHPERARQIGELLRSIREEGRLVIFIEHDLATVRQVADRVIVLDQGRVIAEGETAEVLSRREIAEAYLG